MGAIQFKLIVQMVLVILKELNDNFHLTANLEAKLIDQAEAFVHKLEIDAAKTKLALDDKLVAVLASKVEEWATKNKDALTGKVVELEEKVISNGPVVS